MLRRIASSIGCVLLASLVIGCGTDKDTTPAQGAWKVVAGESRTGSGGISGETIFIIGNTFQHRTVRLKFNAVFSLDSAQSPKHIDLNNATGTLDPGISVGPDHPRSLKGIYEIADDMMRICIDESGAGRPSTFSGSGMNVMLIMKRQ